MVEKHIVIRKANHITNTKHYHLNENLNCVQYVLEYTQHVRISHPSNILHLVIEIADILLQIQ